MIMGASLQNIVACLLMGSGLIFLIGSLVGMLRLPDFYSRVHASGNSETLGLMLVFIGLAVHNGFSVTSGKIIVIFLFVFIGNPIGSHILAKAAYKTGLPIWTQQHPVGDIPEETTRKEVEMDANIHH